MKKRILISALLALTLFSTAIGQMVIRGIVLDAQNGQALPGANIQDNRTGKGTAAATDGTFTLDLGSDKQTTIRVSFLGYEPEEKSFKAHLTLGRVKDDRKLGELPRAIQAYPLEKKPFRLDRLVLFQSTLTPEGPVYKRLHEVKLA